MIIRAFHGLRYNGTAEYAGNRAAPPYDQINDPQRDLMHQVEYHFSHLIRPVAAGAQSAHHNSARLHAHWREAGLVMREEEPSLYANSIERPGGGIRLGLTALVDLEDPSSGIIRPHEETVDKTVAERLDLMRATQADYEPILLLADDSGALETLLKQDCATEPLASHVDEFGNTHHLFRIGDVERIERYRSALADSYALIADGHHRYKTAGLHARETGAARGTATAAKLSVITSLESLGLQIDPIHRALPIALDRQAVERVSRGHSIVGDVGGDALAREVAAAPQPALVVLKPDGEADLWQLDPAHGPDDLPPAASELSAILLHRTLFPPAGLSPENATDGTVAYRSNPNDLAAAVLRGDFAAGVFLPPMTAAGFAGAVADGDVLPPKSTRFLPKVVSGLVWADHADPVA